MKKIRLNVANLEGTEILSREQLKSVFGGNGSGSGSYTLPCKNIACEVVLTNDLGQEVGRRLGHCTGEMSNGAVKCWCDAIGSNVPLENISSTSHCSSWN